jgi:hypothetical protein
MKLPPFLLDHWLGAHEFATPPIRYNLAASTGPAWTLGDLIALDGHALRDQLDSLRLSYAPPEGSKLLRERVAQFYAVDPDWVIVTTGAAEALSALFCLVAEPGASIVSRISGNACLSAGLGLGCANLPTGSHDGIHTDGGPDPRRRR